MKIYKYNGFPKWRAISPANKKIEKIWKTYCSFLNINPLNEGVLKETSCFKEFIGNDKIPFYDENNKKVYLTTVIWVPEHAIEAAEEFVKLYEDEII